MQPTAQAVGKAGTEPAPAGAKDLLSRRIVIPTGASHPQRGWEAEWRDLPGAPGLGFETWVSHEAQIPPENEQKIAGFSRKAA